MRFVDQFKSMNFANDQVMEQQLESVKKELLSKTAEEYRDSAVARARLKNGLSQLANQAKQLAQAQDQSCQGRIVCMSAVGRTTIRGSSLARQGTFRVAESKRAQPHPSTNPCSHRDGSSLIFSYGLTS